MSTLVGARDLAAFEFEPVKLQGETRFAHFRLWIGGHSFGDFSDVLVLGAVCAQASVLLTRRKERSSETLFQDDKTKVFHAIHRALYGFDNRSIAQVEADSMKFSPFDLTGFWISEFDCRHLFLVDSMFGQRALWQNPEEAEICEAIIPAGSIERAAKGFLAAVAPSAEQL